MNITERIEQKLKQKAHDRVNSQIEAAFTTLHDAALSVRDEDQRTLIIETFRQVRESLVEALLPTAHAEVEQEFLKGLEPPKLESRSLNDTIKILFEKDTNDYPPNRRPYPIDPRWIQALYEEKQP